MNYQITDNLLMDYSVLECSGPDALRFLNGQLTCDIENQVENTYIDFARTDRTGKLLFHGLIGKKDTSHFYLFIKTKSLNSLKEDLEKFIIMDDVEITEEKEHSLVLTDELLGDGFVGFFMGIPLRLYLSSNDFNPVSNDKITTLEFFYGNADCENSILINESPLVDVAVSKTKGCYIGQETINKIENNRGAAKKDVLIELNENIHPQKNDILFINDQDYEVIDSRQLEGKVYIKIKAKRDIRIQNKKIELKYKSSMLNGVIKNLPFLKKKKSEIARDYFEKGSEFFTNNEDEKAREYFQISYSLDSQNSEVVESLGVLEGRLGNFKQAIKLMDHLEKIEPNSVMPYTNRSLFYMKMGEIDKAEDEKSKATLKSMTGSQKTDDQLKEEKLKRLNMYEQVLEIDSEDEMANQGAAQINFELNELEKSKLHLEKLLVLNPKNFKALSLMTKVLVTMGEIDQARELAREAMDYAGEKGDFALANDMQSLINSLESL